MQAHKNDNLEKDKAYLISIVREMTKSNTGIESTKHWASDALWFDIPPFASKGIEPAVKMFDSVFKSFKSCKISIIKTLFIRETDCFKKLNDKWQLFHQHASVPSGEWDGKIISE